MGRGGAPQSPPGPLAPPPDCRGGVARWFQYRGAGRRLGGRTRPPLPSALRAPGPRAGPRSGPLPPSLSPRGVGRPGGWGGLVCAGGGSSGQWSAVSGLRGSGPPLALVAPVLSPSGGGARTFAAPYDGGVWVGGLGSAWGSVPLFPPPPPRAHGLGRRGQAVTCVVPCVGAGAGAAAGSAGGSASR